MWGWILGLDLGKLAPSLGTGLLTLSFPPPPERWYETWLIEEMVFENKELERKKFFFFFFECGFF